MPYTTIVDAHLHLWDPSRFRMRWLDTLAPINQRFGPTEYQQQTAGLPIEAMVYLQVDVEPAYALLEAQWVAEQALIDPRIQAMVPWAPIEDGERCRSYLDALVAISPLVKGVRRILQGEADPRFCLQPDFVRGVQLLPTYQLSFDLCLYHYQLPAVIELVRLCPDTQFVVDHLAKPAVRDQQFEPWREQMMSLASLPNVLCKLSGLVTEADHQHWTVADVAPYVQHVFDCFGEDRVMFGGDWPVVLLASSYQRWVETLDSLIAAWSPQAHRKVWADNAKRFYRLPS